ncbi:MAG: HDOD domain-containing protein [Desulfotignum sp.]
MKNVYEKLGQSRHLPQLPQIMVELVKACNNDASSTRELTRIISTDPSLTAKLLQIMGSSYVNLRQEVTTIKNAVVYLGVDTIRNLAISSAALHFFSLSRKLPEFNMVQFWYHSYTCALMAETLAREQGLENLDEFFLAGLLHDIGRLVLMQTFPKEYAPILKTGATEKQAAEAEMAVFETDTSQVSAWLFQQWQLNPLVADAVLFLHEPAEKLQGEMAHIRTIYAANQLSCASDLPVSTKIPDLAALVDIHQVRMEQMVAQVQNDVQDLGRHLEIDCDAKEHPGAEKKVAAAVKDVSLVYGTLENLLKAQDVESIMGVVEKGFRILFQIPRVFFFFCDEKKDLLTGACSSHDKNFRVIKSVALPLSNQTSLIVKSVKTAAGQNSFGRQDHLAVSDIQILRLLETRGFYALPIRSSDRVLGTIVLGGDTDLFQQVCAGKGIVDIFSRQTGICLENIWLQQAYAARINEKKMEAFATMTDKVIHEINNPIAIIQNYLESLSLKLPGRHPAQEELSVVKEEMGRVSLLLDELSSFSKPKITGFDMVDVNQLCTRMLEILKKSMLLPRRIKAVMKPDPQLPRINTDANGIKQVLINLIKNCAEAMENGGEITIRTSFQADSAKIIIGEKKRLPGHIQIQITDNGPGIDPAIMEKMFEPYNSSKKGKKNAGLGLAIVHSIVKQLNGRITCDSHLNKGTSFTILLPVSGEIVP